MSAWALPGQFVVLGQDDERYECMEFFDDRTEAEAWIAKRKEIGYPLRDPIVAVVLGPVSPSPFLKQAMETMTNPFQAERFGVELTDNVRSWLRERLSNLLCWLPGDLKEGR